MGAPPPPPGTVRVHLCSRRPRWQCLGTGRCEWPRCADRRSRPAPPRGRRARDYRHRRPAVCKATAHSNWQATLCAITECLRLVLDNAFGQQPVLLRVEEKWAAAVAGLTTGGDGGVDLARHAQTLLTQCRTTRDVWLTACRQGRGQWWTDRAVAIARQCTDAVWGQPANVWQALPPLTALSGANDECPICYEDFTDALPRPRQPRARAPELFHACGRHAACIDCDRHNPIPRCCLCRADRQPWVQLP